MQHFQALDIDNATAHAYGQLRQELQSRGTHIGMNDYWIEAQALANKMILVTHNTREFERVPGLRVEDWWTD